MVESVLGRNTKPKVKNKHERSFTRQQSLRYEDKRWDRWKNLHQWSWSLTICIDLAGHDYQRERVDPDTREVTRESIHIEPRHTEHDLSVLQQVTGQIGPIFKIHPELLRQLPKHLRPGMKHASELHFFSRNPMTRCSCSMCREPADERRARKRHDRLIWKREVSHELTELAATA